ncbi:hypothetical protein FB451DRAFT_1402466 [Mycena latifolia]|nr:hypothetical protein FB451DRAFT_1402466 [Mycena latifolia]
MDNTGGLQLSVVHPLMEEFASRGGSFSERSARLRAEAATPRARHVCAVRAGSAPRGRERATAHRTGCPSLFASPLLLLGARRVTESPDTVVELTLSLRRLSAKLTLTESALAEHALALARRTRWRRRRHARRTRPMRSPGARGGRGRKDITASSTALEKRVFALESELQVAEVKLSAARALNGGGGRSPRRRGRGWWMIGARRGWWSGICACPFVFILFPFSFSFFPLLVSAGGCLSDPPPTTCRFPFSSPPHFFPPTRPSFRIIFIFRSPALHLPAHLASVSFASLAVHLAACEAGVFLCRARLGLFVPAPCVPRGLFAVREARVFHAAGVPRGPYPAGIRPLTL